MGHSIQALIGHRDGLAPLADLFGPPAPTELAGGLLVVPLFGPRFDTLSARGAEGNGSTGGRREGFTYLGAGLERGLLASVGAASVLYVETHYFGGRGSQAAALFSANALAWAQAISGKPAGSGGQDPGPINRGLAALGVVRTPGLDEFDTVGLARYRSLDRLGVPEDDDD